MKTHASRAEMYENVLENALLDKQRALDRRTRWFNRRKEGREKLAQLARFQYFHGGRALGAPQEMTGFEACKRNRTLEDKFHAALSTDPSARLGAWKPVK